MKSDFFTTKNIILIVLIVCGLGGCRWLSVKGDEKQNEVIRKINAMPHFSNQDSIMEAINAPQKVRCVICEYVFPKCETARDHYDFLDDDCIYIAMETYFKNRRTDQKGKVHVEWTSNGRMSERGKVYFADDVMLEGFDKVTITSTDKKTRNCGDKKDEYHYLKTDAKLTFIAELGEHKAKVVSIDDKTVAWMVQGDIESLSSHYQEVSNYLGEKIFLGFAIFIMVLILVPDPKKKY